ncbi:DUF1788 domain-containing protein [Methanobacterium congolense]|uniref:DUF1788 domain-containing protein n=1 Tax=Methanobacterium congolense TaxID=118062 RepID=A0A1D3L1I9_9EURY|nr:DUF1788 domain-containing protein [Methanobacterium congolense]SCG85425.1 putative protein [Methanobacterium congolense]
MDSIDERLNRIEGIIKKDSFRRNKGLGNEVGYYIFDYDPQNELKVREYISYLKNKINNNSNSSFDLIEFDLYNIIIEILREKGYLKKSFEFEKNKGRNFAKKAIKNLLKLSSESNLIVNHIKDNTPKNSVVFLTGVGKSYPLLRSHNVLNNLHQVLDEVPVVMFFPGRYSGNELILFGTIHDTNYYRAFPLVD